MFTIAIANQKGGVGKSTTTYHLARAATINGLRVLAVDLDPQGNLTSSLTSHPLPEDIEGVADVLSARSNATLTDVLVPGIWAALDVAPTVGETLALVRDELVITGAGREMRLRTALEEVNDHYDLCLIDCAPSLDQLTLNGLSAADTILIVTHSKLWSANGLARLLDTIGDVRRYYNSALTIGGVIVNQHEANTNAGDYWIKELAGELQRRDLRLLQPPIPKRVAISDSVESSTGLDQWPAAGSAYLAEIYSQYLETTLKEAK